MVGIGSLLDNGRDVLVVFVFGFVDGLVIDYDFGCELGGDNVGIFGSEVFIDGFFDEVVFFLFVFGGDDGFCVFVDCGGNDVYDKGESSVLCDIVE